MVKCMNKGGKATVKKGAVELPDKGSKGYKAGGEVKKLAAGGAAKVRRGFPMTKKK